MTAGFRRVALGGITAIAMAGALGSITWAAPGDTGVLVTCYSKSKATYRPIDTTAGQTCAAGEQMIQSYTKAGADGTFLGKTATAADADKLDGLDSSAFMPANAGPFLTRIAADGFYLGINGTPANAANADTLDSLDSTAFLRTTGTAADSAKLGGMLPSAFLSAAGTAADSNKLGGLTASQYLTSTSGTAYDSQRLGGLTASAYLTSTSGTAADSAQLGGKAPSDYLLATAKAADSNKLGGIDSTGFVRGQGSYQRVAVTAVDKIENIAAAGGTIEFDCYHAFAVQWYFSNQIGGVWGPPRNAWRQRGTTGAIQHFAIGPGGAAAGAEIVDGQPEHWTLVLADDNAAQSSATIDIWVMRSGFSCQIVVQTQS